MFASLQLQNVNGFLYAAIIHMAKLEHLWSSGSVILSTSCVGKTIDWVWMWQELQRL